jgi:NhaA family Na+:H+ antiporter
MTFLQRFLALEAAGGIVLMGASLAAIVLANSPLAPVYAALTAVPIGVIIGNHGITEPLRLWVNDGLMAVFFLLVGLEIKREVLEGQLSSRRQLMLPGAAALGGMIVPAVLFLAVAHGAPGALRGWAIPMATDIAFALGVLNLLGGRVPAALKVFLAALAILDDLGAILIIALFYTSTLVPAALLVAFGLLAVLVGLNRAGVKALAPYLVTGVALWVAVFESGIHGTLAGVALALAIPLRQGDHAPLYRLESGLHDWVAFLVIPLFGFINAGIGFGGVTRQVLLDPVTIGIVLALFLGKQLGVMGAAWLVVRLKLAALPRGVGWRQFYGVALLCGIGFTMSLFIGFLAFDDPARMAEVKLGVIGGSLLSAAAGALWLGLARR